jgi:hypothetical protein
MPRRVKGPDGVTHQFPDDATDDEISAALDSLQPSSPAPDTGGDVILDNLRALGNLGVGAAKGLAHTATGLGQMAHAIPGASRGIDALYELAGINARYKRAGMPDMDSRRAFENRGATESALGLDPQGNAEKLGHFLEQMAEFMVPGAAAEKTAATLATRAAPFLGKAAPLASRMAVQGVVNAGQAKAQGADPLTAGVMGAPLPVVGAVTGAAGRAVKGAAVPLVLAAIKPTVTEMKRQAGASITGLNAQAQRLAKFIIDNRLTTPEKAEAMIADAERQVAAMVGGQVTDAPQRAARYLEALKRSASKQALPSDDVAVIQSKARELLNQSPLSETVQKKTLVPTGRISSSGKPVMKPEVEDVRQLRTDVTAKEALDTARASSRWSTRKSWGEQKGAAKEADKAVERAARDAVKTAVPATKPVLKQEAQAITAKKVLDRKAFREGNRDAVSLPAHVIAAGEIAKGRPPIVAMAANWLRNNQMKAGIWADRLGEAIARNDANSVSMILGRLGVAAEVQATKPAYGGSSR